MGNIKLFEEDFTEFENNHEEKHLKKCNTRKSIASLLVYLIIKEETSPEGKHLTRNEILDLLEKREEIKLERKAASRIINTLLDSGKGICSAPGKGVWYDREQVWTDSDWVA